MCEVAQISCVDGIEVIYLTCIILCLICKYIFSLRKKEYELPLNVFLPPDDLDLCLSVFI